MTTRPRKNISFFHCPVSFRQIFTTWPRLAQSDLTNLISFLQPMWFICRNYNLIVFTSLHEVKWALLSAGTWVDSSWTLSHYIWWSLRKKSFFLFFFFYFAVLAQTQYEERGKRSFFFKVIALIIPPVFSSAREETRYTDRQSDRHQLTARAQKTCRHVNSRGGINPWNEADDRFQFRATSKGVNAAALTGMLGVRDTGWGI